ncbi:unnamed protein product [Phytophthora fragariaefolia]|uniref:Unnamed protein product n=1 Tax=Phytophthora fragariaefolia TaxID=1490495 RepID=A0A9W7D5W1_9STRA|nr:unnamed protein product [Phytophthora fragariaefolia]
MDNAVSTATRLLNGENSRLVYASNGKIILTGLLLGNVHVLTGPDHLSALAAMSNGGSWRAFALGIRWGCGHSLGLIIMAVFFFAAGQTIDLDATGEYLNYVVDAFKIALGIWTGKSLQQKYHLELAKEKTVGVIDEDIRSGSCGDPGRLNSGVSTPSVVNFKPELKTTQATNGSLIPDAVSSPRWSYTLMISEEDATTGSRRSESLVQLNDHKTAKQRYCPNFSFENPLMQKIAALSVGIVRGIAGPGGILGVLSAVVLNNWGKSTAYLGSFCIGSIVIMGVFSALYGEITRRLGGNTPVIDFRVGMCSSTFSLIVGCLWIILQSLGVLDDILG